MTDLAPTAFEHIRYALRRLNPEFHENDISWEALRSIEEQNESALILLRRYEYLTGGATLEHPDLPAHQCPCCGWPKGGHDGPGRYKGNAENTHEEGCSLDAVLHGRPAPRLVSNPATEPHKEHWNVVYPTD